MSLKFCKRILNNIPHIILFLILVEVTISIVDLEMKNENKLQ